MVVYIVLQCILLPLALGDSAGRVLEVFGDAGADVVAVVEQRDWQYLVAGRSVVGAQQRDPLLRAQPVFAGFGVMQAVRYAKPGARRALQIGVGAGTVPTYLRRHGIVTDAVEISARVVAAAAAHFGYDDCRGDEGACARSGRTYIADGAALLHGSKSSSSSSSSSSIGSADGGARDDPAATAPPPPPPPLPLPRGAYDIVLTDVFAGENADEHSFFSARAFALMRAKWLAPGGVLCANFVGFVAGPHAGAGRAIAAALRSVFAHVRAFRDMSPSIRPHAPSNIVYFASDARLAFALPRELREVRLTKLAPAGLRAKQQFQQWEVFAAGGAEGGGAQQRCGSGENERDGAPASDFGAAQRALKQAMWAHAREMVAPAVWDSLLGAGGAAA